MVHIRKLDKLVSKRIKIDKTELDLTVTHLKRWVNLLSKYKPADREASLLVKRLNFAIEPENTAHEKGREVPEVMCAGWEKGDKKKEADKLRHEVVSVLLSAKPPKT